MQNIETHKCFGGNLEIWTHKSTVLKCEMRFSIFLPQKSLSQDVPFLMFLSGLTCNHENFTTKAGAYAAAAKAGLAIIAPDTSPRGDHVADDPDGAYDLGKGAGFYLNASQAPWKEHYQMESYIADELPALVVKQFPLQREAQSLCGHSMGGHGALSLYLKYPERYKSASAFAPIVAPARVPWGHKAFSAYLGADKSLWQDHDSCALVLRADNAKHNAEILIDQGSDDSFLTEQLKPELFIKACEKVGQKVNFRLQDGYDHSYYFIQSFITDHIHHHAKYLNL